MTDDDFLGESVGIVLAVGFEHMRYFHEAGWSKDQIQHYMWPRLAAESTGPTDKRVGFPRPDSLLIVAAGGPGIAETQAFLPHLAAPLTEPIRRALR
jgi:hypothetical protein